MEKNRSFAEIIVDINSRRTDRVFHYDLPAGIKERVVVGSRVLVPFGGRKLAGYVVGFGFPESTIKTKDILEIIDEEPVFTPELLELARWMADSYICSTAEALSRILSPRLGVKAPRRVMLFRPALPEDKIREVIDKMPHAPKQIAVIKAAVKSPGLTRKELAASAQTVMKTVDVLVEKGLLEVFTGDSPLLPGGSVEGEAGTDLPRLNPEQEVACKEISGAIGKGKFKAFLLQGVTGSGKTEVYMRAVAAALESGRQAVILVPEISLTPQMIDLFRGRFGGNVAVLHSALAGGERYGEWRRAKEGQAPVVLGTRSAVFAPSSSPGLFVIDEEHEPSYKQDDRLRYHAREIALKRAQQFGAVVVLGSATPSLESQFRSLPGGPYQLLKLPHRIEKRPLPPVRIVDLRQEMREGNRGIFSRSLKDAVCKRMERGEQAILFLNRRGYTTFVVCRECGQVLKCPHCDISLTYHLDGLLRCHYCNYTTTSPKLCPRCGSSYIRHFGVGTQKVEEEARRLFTGARIVRMDSDSTARKGSHEKIVNLFRQGQADILIGTQMIAKGLDLPGVTLVGVINADATLHMPDFRAAERTFQLLTQVAGRTGRGDSAGEVLVQTYCPDHYSIITAASHDCEGFYNHEMPIRRSLGYPPFSFLARLLFTHPEEDVVRKGAGLARNILEKAISGRGDLVDVLGPAPAPLQRIKDQYRWQLVLKGPRRNLLKVAILECLDALEKSRPVFKPAVNVDINPQGMI